MPRSPRPLSAFHEASEVAATPDPSRDAPRAGRAGRVRRVGRAQRRHSRDARARPARLALPPLRDEGAGPRPERDEHHPARRARSCSTGTWRRSRRRCRAPCRCAGRSWCCITSTAAWRGCCSTPPWGARSPACSRASSTPLTFPLLTAIGSSIVAVFVPSSGGQWVVQGFVTAKAAVADRLARRSAAARGRRRRPHGQLPVAVLAGPGGRHRARGLPGVLRLRRACSRCSGSRWASGSSRSCRDAAAMPSRRRRQETQRTGSGNEETSVRMRRGVLGGHRTRQRPSVRGQEAPPAWAYVINPPGFRPPPDDGRLRHVPDSTGDAHADAGA